METYSKNLPSYTAVQWDGNNTADLIVKSNEWFSCFPDQSAVHDAEAGVITTCSGHQLEHGDWLVSAGMWPDGSIDGYPEVVKETAFQARYTRED